MKMMFVIHSLERMGGAEKVLVMLANHFASSGHSVSILVLSDQQSIFDLHHDINVISYHPSGGRKSRVGGMIGQIKFIYSALVLEKSDIVIAFIAASNILTTIAAKLAKRAVIISEHTNYERALTDTRGSLSAKIWRMLRRVVYPWADHLMILTEQDREKYPYVRALSVQPNPLVLSQKYTSLQREKIILGVGRLSHVKGFDMLIDAFAKVEAPDWRLVITGEGDKREVLESKIREYGLEDRVVLTGFVQDMEYYYKRASIYVLSSRAEGFPGGLCEAMGYGCAVVAFDCPTGPAEIIRNDIDGILVEAENVGALRKQIALLIQDEEKRKQLGENAREISERLDIKTIAKDWEEIMTKVIQKHEEEI